MFFKFWRKNEEENLTENYSSYFSSFKEHSDRMHVKEKIAFVRAYNPREIFTPSKAFTKKFPFFTKLIYCSKILEIQVGSACFYLYCWKNKEGKPMGMKCVLPHQTKNALLCKDHQKILEYFGGCIDYWNEPASMISNSMFLLVESNCTIGFNNWNEYIANTFLEEKKEVPINILDFTTFATIANGDCYAYDRKLQRVLAFFHDGGGKNSDILQGCPEWTFYTIKGVKDFRSWIELLSKQWLNKIKVERTIL